MTTIAESFSGGSFLEDGSGEKSDSSSLFSLGSLKRSFHAESNVNSDDSCDRPPTKRARLAEVVQVAELYDAVLMDEEMFPEWNEDARHDSPSSSKEVVKKKRLKREENSLSTSKKKARASRRQSEKFDEALRKKEEEKSEMSRREAERKERLERKKRFEERKEKKLAALRASLAAQNSTGSSSPLKQRRAISTRKKEASPSSGNRGTGRTSPSLKSKKKEASPAKSLPDSSFFSRLFSPPNNKALITSSAPPSTFADPTQATKPNQLPALLPVQSKLVSPVESTNYKSPNKKKIDSSPPWSLSDADREAVMSQYPRYVVFFFFESACVSNCLEFSQFLAIII